MCTMFNQFENIKQPVLDERHTNCKTVCRALNSSCVRSYASMFMLQTQDTHIQSPFKEYTAYPGMRCILELATWT